MNDFFQFSSFLLVLSLVCSNYANSQESEIEYLSGRGNDDALEWDFLCTDGRNSGTWSKIPVPSCWELQGFGTYNYGHDPDAERGKEKGIYRTNFFGKPDWRDKKIRIVFEGSMTDTEVKVNGRIVGEKHQGAFYRFSYDITKLIKINRDNLLEVTVSKHSADSSVNLAERYADYWIFGGIFRPVYLEIKPGQHIERIALDAIADGHILTHVYLNGTKKANRLSGRILDVNMSPVGELGSEIIPSGSEMIEMRAQVDGILPWSPEYPNLYYVEIGLYQDDRLIHQIRERFGFRTVEIRERDGIYVNNVKVKFKGVCRHSFWPETGRTLNKEMSIQDVHLMKEMNMNAVRMSHYPPDPHFLDVCDSLGLFVLDELAGWQAAYGTEIGKKLVREMVVRDVNHPSIIIWDNGNEGGWNTELDDEFIKYDPQKREVIHPWEKFRKTDTNHYIEYNYGTHDSFNGSQIFFPTEVLHGLYDGGHGAGLADFWDLMWNRPTSAGGFLWVFSDESVLRADMGGVLDSDGNHAPDGILGPYREKEGSFYTIKEIWSPVYFEEKYITKAFDGIFMLQNRYHYTNLSQCDFSYRLMKFNGPDSRDPILKVVYEDKIISPEIAPGEWGQLKLDLPADWKLSDMLYVTAIDPYGRELFTWDWPLKLPEEKIEDYFKAKVKSEVTGSENGEFIIMTNGALQVHIEKNTGRLNKVIKSDSVISLSGGPTLAEGESRFENYGILQDDNSFDYKATFKGNLRSVEWTLLDNGILKMNVSYVPNNYQPFFGINFNYPEKKVTGIQWMGTGPYRVWKNRMKGGIIKVWQKEYNQAVTGEIHQYPEFKGYHANMYWMQLENTERDFTIYTATENLFFRLYTPDDPSADPRYTRVQFPEGDISFLQGINAIGTKFKDPKLLGPQSQMNMYRRHPTDEVLKIELYFDFN